MVLYCTHTLCIMIFSACPAPHSTIHEALLSTSLTVSSNGWPQCDCGSYICGSHRVLYTQTCAIAPFNVVQLAC